MNELNERASMKKNIILLLITGLLAGMPVKSAQADDEAVAAIGGFIAGVITGSVIDHDRGGRSTHVYVDGYRRGHYDKGDRGYSVRDYSYGKKRGHWETRRVRVWVPGYWRTTRNECGDRIKVWERGHYVWKHEKVWVSYRDRRDGYCYRD
jgi:hypothetical protein